MRVTVIRDLGLSVGDRRMVSSAALGSLLRACGEHLSVPSRASLAVRCTGDEELRELNRTYAAQDHPTDVLAFPGDGSQHVGDIAISVVRAVAQAEDGVAELRLLAVHGLLHCLGYDHDEPVAAARMTAMTAELLPDQSIPALVAH